MSIKQDESGVILISDDDEENRDPTSEQEPVEISKESTDQNNTEPDSQVESNGNGVILISDDDEENSDPTSEQEPVEISKESTDENNTEPDSQVESNGNVVILISDDDEEYSDPTSEEEPAEISKESTDQNDTEPDSQLESNGNVPPLETIVQQNPVPGPQLDQAEIYLIKTFEKTTCDFCYTELNPGDGMVIRSCLHNFCLDCIRSAIEQSDAAEIPCPTECGGMLLDREIKSLISTEAYQNFINRSLKTAEEELEDIFRCRGPQCPAVFMLPKDQQEFTCPQCGNENCLKCKALKHGDRCTCLKEGSDEAPDAKKPRIDLELKKDWDSSWAQLYESFSNDDDRTSSSTAAGSLSLFDDVISRLEQNEVLLSTNEFTCTICLAQIPPGDGIILKECYHMFCKVCLAGTIEHCDEAKVKCPFQKNDYTCPEFITDREIKALVNPELYETFLRRSVNQAEITIQNSFHCKSVNCVGWCEVEEGAEFFMCPVCKKGNCLKCKAIHETSTCAEYQANAEEHEMETSTKAMIITMMQQGLAKKCPKCKIIIQKNGGCNHMYCTFCKHHFSWSSASKPVYRPRAPRTPGPRRPYRRRRR